jgi:hypothetical protein
MGQPPLRSSTYWCHSRGRVRCVCWKVAAWLLVMGEDVSSDSLSLRRVLSIVFGSDSSVINRGDADMIGEAPACGMGPSRFGLGCSNLLTFFFVFSLRTLQSPASAFDPAMRKAPATLRDGDMLGVRAGRGCFTGRVGELLREREPAPQSSFSAPRLVETTPVGRVSSPTSAFARSMSSCLDVLDSARAAK